MAINKLPEFAKDGQKNTDDLVLTDGFPVLKKPARQWFNWLFNTLTTKINEIIDADFMPKSDVIDNLTTDDETKPVSAKQAKILNNQDFGINQNWVDVTATRFKSVNYTNTSPKPIVIFVYSAGPNSVAIYVGGVLASASFTNTSASNNGVSAVVPPNATYRFETENAVILSVTELR